MNREITLIMVLLVSGVTFSFALVGDFSAGIMWNVAFVAVGVFYAGHEIYRLNERDTDD